MQSECARFFPAQFRNSGLKLGHGAAYVVSRSRAIASQPYFSEYAHARAKVGGAGSRDVD